ncbi:MULTISPECIES: hypothetical protein [Burkholderia]|uniref:hypothetical protein n=1 Tax=Burkholderia TaxID=32008 RepID=UPI000758CC8E|nr:MULTISPECIES: hypothetical protein [Burkholderia]AOJ72079.1 hypothetical protein WS78_25350 [Burkholderia savannae]AOK50542.1 hypothetical protein WT60_27510 [Burkholderia sp. MSMB617WGS]KVG50097.1 hypothetical protein WS77_24065 [Burkholderia sp. MSMB0265]KVG80831.1 hypothetical protein WS81_12365 [Burkholderia sp. MSMB2040]KVG96775.1 hypothetical protein WS83_02235 [Burkholderia sp. MSMB2042]
MEVEPCSIGKIRTTRDGFEAGGARSLSRAPAGRPVRAHRAAALRFSARFLDRNPRRRSSFDRSGVTRRLRWVFLGASAIAATPVSANWSGAIAAAVELHDVMAHSPARASRSRGDA